MVYVCEVRGYHNTHAMWPHVLRVGAHEAHSGNFYIMRWIL